jgi:ABC-type nitrate/sulfonate/bicarbonate transport system substrate-binding protein
MTVWRRNLIALAMLLLSGAAAHAIDKVKVGKAVPNSFAFSGIEVGLEAKIFAQEGLELEVSAFRGDAQMQQALTAGSVDFGFGSGPGMGFRVKGVPAVAVAAMYGPPANLALLVPANSPIKTVADLKGKRVGVTTVGSLTDWLVRELSRQQGWGPTGIQIAPLGSIQARLAALDRGELDGTVQEAANGYELEEAGKTRNLLLFGDIAKHFYTHVIFATNDVVDKRPEVVARFLRGWFKTVRHMKANKDFTIRTSGKVIEIRPSVMSKVYDTQIASFSDDGAWDMAALDVIRHSLHELGILNRVPEAKELYTDKFVPVKF